MQPTDLPLTPEDRFREIAAVLAVGLLRLHTRPPLAAASAVPGEQPAPLESEEILQKRLGLSAPARTDLHPG